MRSLLFVPADGGSKLDKAFSSGADAVIIDLEDSVAPDRKAAARASAAAFLRSALTRPARPRLLVRVNALATGLIDDWREVRPYQKLAGQLVAAGAVYAAGYRLEAIALPAGDAIHLTSGTAGR